MLFCNVTDFIEYVFITNCRRFSFQQQEVGTFINVFKLIF